MSKEAIEYKLLHKDIKYENLSLNELNKFPPHNGVYNFKISKTYFLMLNIINDDSSLVKHFWKGSHDIESLDLWYKITRSKGLYIDVGAHTGLYTITAIKANTENQVISFEPYFMNMSRLITNLRLNGFSNKALASLILPSDRNSLICVEDIFVFLLSANKSISSNKIEAFSQKDFNVLIFPFL